MTAMYANKDTIPLVSAHSVDMCSLSLSITVFTVIMARVEYSYLFDLLQPSMYLAHLIGHEGNGSLLSLLRTRGWCNELLAGPSEGANGFMFFIVNVDLTEDGEGEM